MKLRLSFLLAISTSSFLALLPPSASAHTYNVEIDWFVRTGSGPHDHKPTECELNAIKAAFQRKGHTWNWSYGNAITETDALQTLDFITTNAVTFDAFDRPADEWGTAVETPHRAGGAGVRYMVFMHGYRLSTDNGATFGPVGSSGLAELPGDECVVTLGVGFSASPAGSPWDRAGTAMHEFGHNIGLRHAGNQNEGVVRQYKPNFPSVMAYRYQLLGVKYGLQCQGLAAASALGPYNNLDYSSGGLAQLDENALNEATGLGLSMQVDWDCDATNGEANVANDLSSQGGGIYGVDWCTIPVDSRQVITDYDDWANIAALSAFTQETRELAVCASSAELHVSAIDCPTQPNPCDEPTATLATLVSAQAQPDRVNLEWFALDAASLVIMLYRQEAGGDWSALGRLTPDGSGRLFYEDRDVAAGRRYGYRLGIRSGDSEQQIGEVWVDVPSGFELALAGIRPNPASGDLVVSLSLPSRDRARLELIDVAGRRVAARELGFLDAGRHVVNLGDSGLLEPGIYMLRLVHGKCVVSAKAAIVR